MVPILQLQKLRLLRRADGVHEEVRDLDVGRRRQEEERRVDDVPRGQRLRGRVDEARGVRPRLGEVEVRLDEARREAGDAVGPLRGPELGARRVGEGLERDLDARLPLSLIHI